MHSRERARPFQACQHQKRGPERRHSKPLQVAKVRCQIMKFLALARSITERRCLHTLLQLPTQKKPVYIKNYKDTQALRSGVVSLKYFADPTKDKRRSPSTTLRAGFRLTTPKL